MKPKKAITWKCQASTCFYTVAAIFLLSGFALMWCEGSDFAHFRPEIFSPLRVRIAPLLCLVGYLLVGWGIMAKPGAGK